MHTQFFSTFTRTHRGAAAALLVSTAAFVVSACSNSKASEGVIPPAPTVEVVHAAKGAVAEKQVYSGRFEAIERVDIRPRVSGYITAITFTPGSNVKKGQVLFKIDPRPFQATLAQAQGARTEATAARGLASLELERARRLFEKQAISREMLDQRQAAMTIASAKLQAAEGQLAKARLDLDYSVMSAPINGVIGRADVTVGNLVSENQALALTTIEANSPLYVAFDIEDSAYAGKSKQIPDWKVAVGAAGQENFVTEAKLAFADNKINPQTATLRLRASVPNKDGNFLPGQFARVQLTTGEIPNAVRVDERAVRTEQGQRYVLVVGKDKVLQYKPVTVGAVVGHERVIRQGLEGGEQVVVSGQMGVRAGIAVNAKPISLAPLQTALVKQTK